MKSLLAVAFLTVLLLSWGCGTRGSLPSKLARHWISTSEPRIYGLQLNSDGTGRIAGNDPTVDDGFLRWEVRDGKLMLLFHGEEGEHGDYQAFDFTLSGGKLHVLPPVLGGQDFTAHQ